MKNGRHSLLLFLLLSLSAGGLLIGPALAQHAGHGGAPQAPAGQSREGSGSGGRDPGAKAEPEGGRPEDAEEAPTVEIPLDKQQMIGVKTVAVSVRPLHKTIRTIGRVEYDERKLSTINTKFEGWIERLHVDYVGKQVKKGEPLAEIYSPELLATQQELLSILKWSRPAADGAEATSGPGISRDAESFLDAARQRLRLWGITDKQIKELESTGKAVRTITIYSPSDGVVVQKAALQGMRFMPGEKLFDIADLSGVWIIADIYEFELAHIRPGTTAKITLSSFPGKEFSAVIDYIYPVLTGETRTVKVRLSLPNPGGRIKPQMFSNVELRIAMGSRLAVPEEAVIDTGLRQIVYVDKGEGYFEPREVTLGVRADGLVEVLKGLKAREKVASAGNFLIDSEAKLKGIVK